MVQEDAREELARLHAQLADAHRAHPAVRRSLDEILPHIQRWADDPGGSAGQQAHSTLPERLEGVAAQFEVEHPTLAASARRLIQLLSSAGI